jgi:hypothetical protein
VSKKRKLKRGRIMTEDDIAIDERKHMESVVISRFNFFITFFSIVIAGAATTFVEKPIISVIILSIGLVILWLVKIPLNRCQMKFDIILEYLLPKEHTNNTVNHIIDCIQKRKKYHQGGKYYKLVNKIKGNKKLVKKINKSRAEKDKIGFTIPNVCLIILALLDLCTIFYIIKYWPHSVPVAP